MVEPVTTATAAGAATGAIGDAVSSAASSAATSAGNWFTNMISAPFRWVASLPGRALSAVGGAAQGVLGSLWTGLTATAVITGVKLISPELWRSADRAIGGDERVARTAAMVERDGIAGVVLDSAIQGFGGAAALSAASGAISSGGVLPGGAVVAGVGAVVLGMLNAPATPTDGASRANGETRNT